MRRTLAICVALSLLLTAISPSAAQSNQAQIQTIIDETLKAELKRQKLPGVAVAFISKQKIIHTKGIGFADIEGKVPFTDETIVNWASNSKPVMAILAMQLVQSGQLDLDESIDNYLPEIPAHLHSITTRQLLCHQSGIPHYSNGKIIRPETPAKPLDEHDPSVAMQRFIQSPLIFQPGEKREYSSHAYVLLSAVVQSAGDQPIADQLSSRILQPLGIESFQLDVAFSNQAHWCNAYRLRKERMVAINDYAHFWKHGAGGYKSNVKDFARFANALMKSELISKKTGAQMMTIQNTSDGKPTTSGLGVYVAGTGKSLKVSHNGSQDETKTRMVIYPKLGHGIVVMSNCNHAEPGKITTAIYNALKKQKVKF